MSATKSQMSALLQKAAWRLRANKCYASDSAQALLSDIENLIGNQEHSGKGHDCNIMEPFADLRTKSENLTELAELYERAATPKRSNEIMRQTFEEWCLSALPRTARELRADGRYSDPTIEILWQSWQASRESLNAGLRWPDGLQNY